MDCCVNHEGKKSVTLLYFTESQRFKNEYNLNLNVIKGNHTLICGRNKCDSGQQGEQ